MVKPKWRDLLKSDPNFSDIHKSLVQSSLKDIIKERNDEINKIKQLDEQARKERYSQIVNIYNRQKEEEYNRVVNSLKQKYPNYYKYYKDYEKKHGWQKTTQILEKNNLMRKWVNYSSLKKIKNKTKIPVTKHHVSDEELLAEIDRINHRLKEKEEEYKRQGIPHTKADVETAVNRELLKEYQSEAEAEDQYIKEQKIKQDIDYAPTDSYISKRMLRAGFTEIQVKTVLKALTYQEKIEFAQRMEREMPIENEKDYKELDETTPDTNHTMEDIFNSEYLRIIRILEEYEMFI